MNKEEIRKLKNQIAEMIVDPEYDYCDVITGTKLDNEEINCNNGFYSLVGSRRKPLRFNLE